VLVGDPGRPNLPLDRLTELARYDVPEVGRPRGTATTPASVYAFG
jgi:predicted nicotinamide N-methyase